MEARSWPRRPTWRPQSDLGGQLGGPKMTQLANLEAQAAKEANLEAPRPPRRPTWEAKGGPRRQLGPKMQRNGLPKGPKRVPK